MKRRKAQSARQSNLLPLLLIAAGVLLLLALLFWQLSRQAPQTADIPNPDIERVSLSDARTAFEQQSAIFLDVRDPASFEAAHIPGAINIPVAQIETRLAELDANARIITYCT